jgi:hypothetical protein
MDLPRVEMRGREEKNKYLVRWIFLGWKCEAGEKKISTLYDGSVVYQGSADTQTFRPCSIFATN